MFSPPSPLPGKKACFLCYVWALWRSRTERGSFHRPSQQAELLKPFLPSKKIFFIAIFTLAWAWKQSNLTALYSCSRGERRGLALSTAPRGGSKPAAPTGDFEFSGPAELAPAGPGGPDPAVPAAGHRGAPKPHGWGGGAGAGPRGPAAAPPRGAAGRGRRGGPQRPVPRWSFSDLAERRPGGRAGAGERRELLTAPAAGVCRLPGRRFEACSCCPPPRRVASRRVAAVEPGEEQRQPYAAFGRLPGGREERSGMRLRVFLGKFVTSPLAAVGCCPLSPSSLRAPQPPANFFCAYLF